MIQVGFSHVNGFWSFLSKIIMGLTGRPYSHCWLLCRGSEGYRNTDLVLTEDEDGGLHFVPWSTYPMGKTIVTVLELPYDVGPGLDALLQKLSEGYDFTGLLGEGWVIAMGRWFHRKVKNPLAIASRMWCSEAVFYALSQVPQSEISTGTSIEVTPGQLYDFIIQKGGKPVEGYQFGG